MRKADSLEHPITFEDGDLCIGGAPIARSYRADDFPCRDEDKTDAEHQQELNALTSRVCTLAETARQLELSPHFCVIMEIGDERHRQVLEKDHTPEKDDLYTTGALALAAALYAIPYDSPVISQEDFIGLDVALCVGCNCDFRPEPDKRKRLLKAAALIVAEIERMDRAHG